MERALLVGAEEVIPAEEPQRVRGACPRVHEEQQEVLEVGRTDAVVHPRTVVIHVRDTAVADPAVVGTWWLEGLALSAHRVRVLEKPLPLGWYGLDGDAPRIGERGLGVTSQCQGTQYVVYHPQNDGDTLCDREGCDGRCGVQQQQPHHGRHDAAGLIGRIAPDAVVLVGAPAPTPGLVVVAVDVVLTPLADPGVRLGRVVPTASRRVVVVRVIVLQHFRFHAVALRAGTGTARIIGAGRTAIVPKRRRSLVRNIDVVAIELAGRRLLLPLVRIRGILLLIVGIPRGRHHGLGCRLLGTYFL